MDDWGEYFIAIITRKPPILITCYYWYRFFPSFLQTFENFCSWGSSWKQIEGFNLPYLASSVHNPFAYFEITWVFWPIWNLFLIPGTRNAYVQPVTNFLSFPADCTVRGHHKIMDWCVLFRRVITLKFWNCYAYLRSYIPTIAEGPRFARITLIQQKFLLVLCDCSLHVKVRVSCFLWTDSVSLERLDLDQVVSP
jgi:hypothetical protein